MQKLIGLLLACTLPLFSVADERALDYAYTDLELETGPSQDQYQLLLQHLRNDQLDAAISAADRLLEMNLDLTDDDPVTYGKLLANLGILHAARYQYQEALAALTPATEFITENQNPFDMSVVPVSIATGIVELELNKIDDAEDSFRRAQHVMHRNDGVYAPNQLKVLDFLTRTNIASQDPVAADRQQKFKLRVSEQAYGENSEELVPILLQVGSYFARRGGRTPLITSNRQEKYIQLDRVEQQFDRASEMRYYRDSLFKQSLSAYNRAIKIIEDNYGVNDLRIIEPLQGLAKARMLQITHRKAAEKALERVLSIVENSPDTDVPDRARAIVALADMYVINGDRRSIETYKKAWQLMAEDSSHAVLSAQYFGSPKRLYPDHPGVRYLDRKPDAAIADPNAQLYVEVSYAVRPDGRVHNIRLVDRNLPNKQVAAVRAELEKTKYRPRMIDGEVMETQGLVYRQLFETIEQVNRRLQPVDTAAGDSSNGTSEAENEEPKTESANDAVTERL